MPRRPSLSEDVLMQAYEEWKSGVPLDELARRYGVTKSTLHYHLKKLEKEGKVEVPKLPKSPDLKVLKLVSDQLVVEAQNRLNSMLRIGKLVWSTFWKEAVSDPEYAQKIYTQPDVAMIEFVAEALSARRELLRLKDEIAFTINYLLDIIERQRRIIETLLPKLSPAIRFETEARLAIEAINMALLARVFGIKLDHRRLLPIIRKSVEVAYRRNVGHERG